MSQQIRYSLIGAAIVTVILVIGYLAVRTNKSADVKATKSAIADESGSSRAQKINELMQVKDIDVVFGDENAPITMIEYASYSCSHCANFSLRVFPDIKEEFIDTGKVKFILRDFPLDEPSLRASQLSRCINKDGYAALSKTLFQQRQNWAFSKDFPEKLENIAKIIGVSGKQFHDCMADKELEEKILNYRYNVSNTFNISSTPSFIINGKKYNGNNSFSAMSEYLMKLLEE
ncbi:MAG: DsbA family protein [Rickettsiales bacterium]|nr:DsbA family protein [Rickettsiales bacterium]